MQVMSLEGLPKRSSVHVHGSAGPGAIVRRRKHPSDSTAKKTTFSMTEKAQVEQGIRAFH